MWSTFDKREFDSPLIHIDIILHFQNAIRNHCSSSKLNLLTWFWGLLSCSLYAIDILNLMVIANFWTMAAFISVLHLYESFGWWRRSDYIKVHFAESWNEMHHLLIMEVSSFHSFTGYMFLLSILLGGHFFFFSVGHGLKFTKCCYFQTLHCFSLWFLPWDGIWIMNGL